MRNVSAKEKIYLAILLRNVGAFSQLASKETEKTLEHHVRQFVERNKVCFSIIEEEQLEEIVKMAIGLPTDDFSGKILSYAYDLALEDANVERLRNEYMTHIASDIGTEGNKDDKWYVPIHRLSLNDACFPKQKPENRADFLSLWNDFEKDFSNIQVSTCEVLNENMLNLFYEYAICIPSFGESENYVSLYDSCKMSIALATALYMYSLENSQFDSETCAYLLVGADFSGIQPYIYQIVSSTASKNLKGRSFYLRLISDAIVRYLLKELELYRANIIYNSGGSFYMVVPNTQKAKETINQCVREIERKLFDFHNTVLYVAIDYIECSFRESDDIWLELFEKRDKQKQRKFKHVIQTGYDDFFMPLDKDYNNVDRITGEAFNKKEPCYQYGDLSPLKLITKQQIELGEHLRSTDAMLVSTRELPEINSYCIQPLNLGLYYYFLEKKETCKKTLNADSIFYVVRFNETPFTSFGLNNGNAIYSMEFYGGNEMLGRSINTFEQMCDNDNFKRLGVLRMDVDNLGAIFQQGLRNRKNRLSAYATLSRCFDYFFSGYLNTIWKENVNAERLQIIYSGGDDVFMVGSWESTIDISEKIYGDFKKYFCENPHFGLSAGISIIQQKFPIMKGAEKAAEEEDNAKKHICKGIEKNSISFMKHAFNWQKEYEKVRDLKNSIVRFMNENKLNDFFCTKLISHYGNFRFRSSKTNIKTFWMITYDLSRFKESVKDKDVKTMIDNCIKETTCKINTLNGSCIETDYDKLELWAFAARWAKLETRANKE